MSEEDSNSLPSIVEELLDAGEEMSWSCTLRSDIDTWNDAASRAQSALAEQGENPYEAAWVEIVEIVGSRALPFSKFDLYAIATRHALATKPEELRLPPDSQLPVSGANGTPA